MRRDGGAPIARRAGGPDRRANAVYREPDARAAQAGAWRGRAAAVNDEPPPPSRPHDSRRGALVGLAVAVLLIFAALALVRVLRRQGALEDCLMSGRTNCAPIDTAAAPR